ncbi:MAG TPA: ABC transporter permease subunit [Armatimonadota bacterium]|nr:ABC transporter permease subunit [Armatimonadota bacterium]
MDAFRRSVSNTITIARRELYAFFVSPVAYVVVFFQFAVCGYLFNLMCSAQQPLEVYRDSMYGGGFPGVAPTLLFWLRFTSMIAFPAITMRLFAEERRSGTIEQLMCNPVRDIEVVLGKYLAGMGIFAVMLLLSMIFPFWIHKYSQQEWGQMLAGYLSFVGTGAVFMAVGLFVSSLTRSQVTAFLLSLGALFLLWMIGWGADKAQGTAIGQFLQYVSLENAADDLVNGILDVRAAAYYISLTAFFLFGTVRSLASTRAQ